MIFFMGKGAWVGCHAKPDHMPLRETAHGLRRGETTSVGNFRMKAVSQRGATRIGANVGPGPSLSVSGAATRAGFRHVSERQPCEAE